MSLSAHLSKQLGRLRQLTWSRSPRFANTTETFTRLGLESLEPRTLLSGSAADPQVDHQPAIVMSLHDDDDLAILADPDVNLTATIDDKRLPSSVVAGANDRLKVGVKVFNEGTDKLDRSARITINLYVRPAGGDPVFLGSLTDKAIGNLKPDASRTFKTTLTLPASMEDGNYALVAVIDSQNTVMESDETDNTATGDRTLQIFQGFYNFTATLNDARLPDNMLAGSRKKLSVPVIIKNEGNLPLDRSVRIDINIYAKPVLGDDEVLLHTLTNQKVGGLKPGASKSIKASFALPIDLPTNDYYITAIVDTTNVVEERNENDNKAVGVNKIATTWLAPDTLANFNVTAKIKSGTSPYGSKGSYTIATSHAATQYLLAGDGKTIDSSRGNMTYTRTSYSQAVVQITDSITGAAEIILNFTREHQATYTIVKNNVVQQTGTMKFKPLALLSPDDSLAPVSIGNWVGNASIKRGGGVLASSGKFDINLLNPNYIVTGKGNVASSTGDFTYRMFNDHTGLLDFDDSLAGSASVVLLFTSTTKASYFMFSDLGWQLGTIKFTLPT